MSREDSSKVETTNQSKERASASDVKVHSQVSFAQILHEFCVTKKRERERDSVLSFLYFNFLVILVGGSLMVESKACLFHFRLVISLSKLEEGNFDRKSDLSRQFVS